MGGLYDDEVLGARNSGATENAEEEERDEKAVPSHDSTELVEVGFQRWK